MRFFFHTLLHTDNSHAVSQINAGLFLVVSSHNPLVPGSSPGGSTNMRMDCSDVVHLLMTRCDFLQVVFPSTLA